ncbi:MAG: UPF0164 family protein [Candidatus Kryptonium sp.]
MKIKFLKVLFPLFLFFSLAYSDNSKYAGEFLRIPIGARALGMGGAFIAIANDGSSFYYNPAGVAISGSGILSFMYSSQFGGITSPLASFFHLGFIQNVQNLGIAVNWVRLSVEDIPLTPDFTSVQTPVDRENLVKSYTGGGLFNDIEDAFYFSFSREFRFNINFGWSRYRVPVSMPIGMNFKLLNQKLGSERGTGFGLDIGVMFRFSMDDFLQSENIGDVSISLALKDLGKTRIAWSTRREHFVESTIMFGLAYTLPVNFISGKVTVAYGSQNSYLTDRLYGFEYSYRDLLFVRFGKSAENLTLGAGVKIDFLAVDYAFLAHDLGAVHRISGSLTIEKILKKL